MSFGYTIVKLICYTTATGKGIFYVHNNEIDATGESGLFFIPLLFSRYLFYFFNTKYIKCIHRQTVTEKGTHFFNEGKQNTFET